MLFIAVSLASAAALAACSRGVTATKSNPNTERGLELVLEHHEVHPGQVTDLEIRFPFEDSYMWGLETRIEESTPMTEAVAWRPLFFVGTAPDASSPARAIRARKRGNTAEAAFSSRALNVVIPIKIPPLGPGSYRICKDFVPEQTSDQRFRTLTACDYFEVVRR